MPSTPNILAVEDKCSQPPCRSLSSRILITFICNASKFCFINGEGSNSSLGSRALAFLTLKIFQGPFGYAKSNQNTTLEWIGKKQTAVEIMQPFVFIVRRFGISVNHYTWWKADLKLRFSLFHWKYVPRYRNGQWPISSPCNFAASWPGGSKKSPG